jgi:hypothetical protein
MNAPDPENNAVALRAVDCSGNLTCAFRAYEALPPILRYELAGALVDWCPCMVRDWYRRGGVGLAVAQLRHTDLSDALFIGDLEPLQPNWPQPAV